MAETGSCSGVYRPRRPERTVLYRALAQHFERFTHLYEERFEPAHGPLRNGVQEAVYRYLDCGIFENGFARARCGECGHDFLVAFSCKIRCLCPSCHQKREILWAEWAAQELLEEVPHRQVVLTIPKRLRIFFRYDRKLLGDLASCAWRALRLYFGAYFDDPEVTPGAVGFLQTSGELLNFHPHTHLLVTDGGWLPDGTFRHLAYFDSSQLERLFRAEVLRMLVEKGLIGEEVVENLLSWPHSGFSAHGELRVTCREEAARIGRYMIRCPLVLERLSWDEATGEVLYRTRPSRSSGPFGELARWDVLEFIARVVDHIPAPHQQLTRYWGHYSNASRGKRRLAAARNPAHPTDVSPTTGAPIPLPAPDEQPHRRRARLTWAALIKKIYEIDPLLCAFCGSQMKIIAFITEYDTVRKILEHIHLPPQRPEPLAHSPPTETELLYA